MPTIEENYLTQKIYPNDCRISDLTYSANILVDVEYFYMSKLYQSKNVKIGKIPIMLGSSHCYLSGKSELEVAEMNECPYDPRGYFIIKGVEKVVLIQEQMAKNRIIVEYDSKQEEFMASVTSVTYETKSRASVIVKSFSIS